jgi:CPA2 family monovalent cation:H+ antiporter-2
VPHALNLVTTLAVSLGLALALLAVRLVIATPDAVSVRQMATIARTLNPAIEIVVRTHSDDEARLLAEERVGTVFFGEQELAGAMARHVLGRRGIAA